MKAGQPVCCQEHNLNCYYWLTKPFFFALDLDLDLDLDIESRSCLELEIFDKRKKKKDSDLDLNPAKPIIAVRILR